MGESERGERGKRETDRGWVERERERERDRDRDRDRETETDRQTDRQTDRLTDRQRQTKGEKREEKCPTKTSKLGTLTIQPIPTINAFIG